MKAYFLRNKKTGRYLSVEAECEKYYDYYEDVAILQLDDNDEFPGIIFSTTSFSEALCIRDEGEYKHPYVYIYDFKKNYDLEIVEVELPK